MTRARTVTLAAPGAPVGASQVTALLRRVAKDSGTPGYEANFTAWLTASYWVRLTDPVELDSPRLALLAAATEGSVSDWCDAVTRIRGGPADDTMECCGLL